jgi:shikimate dehydrogenase
VTRAAVLGRPITHSLSPVLHRAAYAELGLDWSYEAIDCDEAALPEVLAERSGWAGFSCTMPLKRAVLAVADEVAPVARAIGAGNTLLPRAGGGWIADNTDVAGIVASLAEHVVQAKTATVLGAGGTAQAAVAALAVRGVEHCTVLVREPNRTELVGQAAEAVGLSLTVARLDPEAGALDADLVVSTLPGNAADAFAQRSWRAEQSLLDVVYSPWPTPLAAAAGRAGAKVVSGALMLLHQAAAQVALMTGEEPPVGAMRIALAAARPAAGV